MAPDAVEPDDGADRSVGLGRASGQPSEIQGVAETDRPREAAVDRGASARSHPAAGTSSRPYRRTPGSGFIAGSLRRRLGPGNRTRHRIHCVDAVTLIEVVVGAARVSRSLSKTGQGLAAQPLFSVFRADATRV